MSRPVHSVASPNLAILKYWGKRDDRSNLPDTPSLGVTLSGLVTETTVRADAERDLVMVNGEPQAERRYEPFFRHLRERLGVTTCFRAESTNSFPTGAGIASSASGFAALAIGAAAAAGLHPDRAELSRMARVGSASAARSCFGGFVLLPAGGHAAEQVYPPNHWPELRVVVAVVERAAKPLSSRDAMRRCKDTSPYYDAWVRSSVSLVPEALEALSHRDLSRLGELARISFMRMFATMMGAVPPVLYWRPESLGLIELCRRLRERGIGAHETMDAGPQVKIFCLERDVPAIVGAIHEEYPRVTTIEAGVGLGARLAEAEPC
jgi:diphosphomevalonate decarboxylase